jgi:hypothetical protein
MNKRDKLEPLPDGFVAFHTESGEHWKHKDVEETTPDQPARHYRLFISDKGEQFRYVFGPRDPRDSTIWDLREQLKRAERVPAGSAGR